MNKEKCITICDRIMEYGLYLLAYFLPISKAIIEICATTVILAFLIKRILIRNFATNSFLDIPLLAYVFICGFSTIFSSSIAISIRTFSTKLIENVLIFFVVTETINTKKKMRNIITIFFISSALVCIDGISQFFTHKDFIRHRNWPYDTKPFTLRIMGPFITPNDLAAYLTPLVIINLSLFFVRFKSLFVKYSFRLLGIALLICLFLALSRGAWIGFIFGLLFIIIFGERRIAFILLFLILISTSLLPFLSQSKKAVLVGRLNYSDAGGYQRKILNRIGWDMWKERPIFGLGLGTFMYNFERFNYDKKTYSYGPTYAHNCYMQMLAETGILGLGAFMWVIIALFKKSLKIIKISKDYIYRNVSIGLLGGLLAYLVHSAFDTNLYSLDIGILFWYLLGLSISSLKFNNST